MVTGFFVDLANVVAEFAGVAASMEMFHVSRYIAVPIAAILVWILVMRGTYRQVEVIFLVACGFYVTYIISAILAKPNWLEAAQTRRDSESPFQCRLSAHSNGARGDDDCPVAIFLLASRLRREKSRAQAIPPGSRGRVRRQHQLHGDRVFYHRGYGGHVVRFRPAQHYRCGGGGPGAHSSGGEVGGIYYSLSGC